MQLSLQTDRHERADRLLAAIDHLATQYRTTWDNEVFADRIQELADLEATDNENPEQGEVLAALADLVRGAL